MDLEQPKYQQYVHSNVTGQSYYNGTYVNANGSSGTRTFTTPYRGSFTCTAHTCTSSGN